MSSVAAILEESQQFLKKLNVELLDDIAVPLLGVESESTCTHKTLCVNAYSSVIHNSQHGGNPVSICV